MFVTIVRALVVVGSLALSGFFRQYAGVLMSTEKKGSIGGALVFHLFSASLLFLGLFSLCTLLGPTLLKPLLKN
jgi:hypothetical protein